MNLKNIISRSIKEVRNSDTVKDLFKKYKVDLDELDLIPICFKDDLEVSARTEHAIIYLNKNLLEKPETIPSYLAHEITHFLQQTTGDGPTKGSNDDSYLDNPYEIEGFNSQTEYISETDSDHAAENYTNKILDHHGVPAKERAERKKELMHLAAAKDPEQLILFPKKKKEREKLNKTKEELDHEYEEAIALGPQESHARPIIKKLHPLDQGERVRRLKKILEMLEG